MFYSESVKTSISIIIVMPVYRAGNFFSVKGNEFKESMELSQYWNVFTRSADETCIF